MTDDIKTKNITHPLEEVFDIEPNSTLVEYKEPLSTELVNHPAYDKKDDEIEQQLEDVRSEAMNAFEMQIEEAEQVDGKYKAIIGETAANFLNIALNAIKEKAVTKQNKDKLVIAQQKANTPDTVNQNLIIADRNEILKLLQKQEK